MRKTTRNGFSFLELQVALVLFGIALTGLGPLLVMQLKQLEKIEGRFSDRTTYYLVPTSDEWARKLGAAASIKKIYPGTPPPSNQTPPVNDVSIVSIAKSLTSEEVTAHVSVTVIP
jgi:prepilin-type N-terminal cleavage/methylation domain-containing protein